MRLSTHFFQTLYSGFVVLLGFVLSVSALADEPNQEDAPKPKIIAISDADAEVLREKKRAYEARNSGSSFLRSFSSTASQSIERDYIARENSDDRLSVFGQNLMGESVDLKTGATSFEQVDISIPGNSNLEVAIRRTRHTAFPFNHLDSVTQQPVSSFYGSSLTKSNAFSDWGLDIPNISMVMPLELNEFGAAGSIPADDYSEELCQGGFIPPVIVMGPHIQTPEGNIPDLDFGDFALFERHETSNGVELNIPGHGAKKLLENPQGISWPSGTNLVSKDFWTVTCGAARSGPDEAIATAPDGTQYTFGRYDVRPTRGLEASGTYINEPINMGDNPSWTTVMPRVTLMLQATEVRDIHDNWVKYEYDSQGWLTRIHSNDGREILIAYGSNGLVSTITVNNTINDRVWTYNYVSQSGQLVLSEAVLPDSRKWEFNLSPYVVEANSLLNCEVPDVTWTLTHPSGVHGDFLFQEKKMKPVGGSNGRRLTCGTPQAYVTESSYDAMVLSTKTLSGANYPAASWQYDYTEYDETAPNVGAMTAVTDPLGVTTKTQYISPAGQSLSQNLIESVEVIEAGATTPMQTTTYEYAAEAPLGTTWLINENQDNFTRPNHQIKTITTQDGDTYTSETEYNTIQSASDYSYGNPTTTRAYSNISTTHRVTDTTYEHNTSSWILGLPKTVTQNGRLLATNYYDPNTSQLTSIRKYGASYDYVSLAYNTDGTVDTVTDANGRVTKASNWKRGTAQDITSAFGSSDAITEHQYVDDNGWLTSKVDAKGQTTVYSHDVMGRLTNINPAGTYFIGTNIAYTFPPSGGATQTITKGNAVTTVTYDGLFRPTLEQSQSTSTGWSSYVNTEYDALGRVVFKSQPSLSPAELSGMTTTYDGLGRILTQTETASGAQTVHSYHSNHRYTVRDPEFNYTHYYSLGYDGPGSKDYRLIYEASGGRATDIFKNIWGETTRVRQRGSGPNAVDSKMENQFFYYDAQRRLCRYRGTEGGDTVYQYDDAGQMVAYQKGLANGAPCVTPSGTAKVSMSYDDLGRMTLTDFTDTATPDISRTYDDNGNLLTLNRNGVDWTYEYNELDLLEKETLSIDGLTFPVDHIYNNRGHVAWKVHPTNTSVGYAPDGLGRATQAKWGTTVLADNITYHPSGSVYQIEYGNDQVFNQYLNTRLLPQRLHATGNGVTPLDLTYTYDQRAKITSILDGAVSGNDRSYTYDALGQLKTATGPWGTQSNDYDTFGNVLSREFHTGGTLTRSIDLQYDSKNRVYNSVDSAAVGTSFGNSGTGSRTVGYDSRGNVTTLGTMGFVYDYSDQPTIINGSLAGTSFNSSGFIYDGNLKRVKSVINGRTIYNVYDSTGALIHVRKMAHGQEPEERSDYVKAAGKSIARLVRNGASGAHKTYYSFSDHLGSPVATMEYDVTDPNPQIAIETERYTPFGIAMNNPNVLSDQAGFTGHIKDSATGLNYMQARYYDPVMGRFLSIDPVTFLDLPSPGQFNRYAYTWNDPINAIDPDGKRPQGPPQTSFSHKVKVALRGAQDVVGHSLAGLSPHASYNPSGPVPILNQGDVQAYAIGATVALGASMLGPGDEAMAASTLTRAAKVGCCFVAGTLVETEDGLRPIEEVEIGDLVLSRNPETGETTLKAVTAFIPRHDRIIWTVELSGSNGTYENFETTDEHPWWVISEAGNGRWIRTDELSAGMVVTTADNQTMTIMSALETERLDGTYNITVADFETYFVGENRVLVHNCKFFGKTGWSSVHKGSMNTSKFDNMSTDDIVESLFDTSGAAPNTLKVGDDGRVWNGNARLQALEERGADLGKVQERWQGAAKKNPDEFTYNPERFD